MENTSVYIFDRRPILFGKFNICFGSIILNSLSILSTLQNLRRMLVSFVHSIEMCFIVYWFPHGHLGGGSSFKMKE